MNSLSLLNVIYIYIYIAKPHTSIDLLAVMQNGYIEICALLGLYEEWNGNSVPFREDLLVPCSRVKQSNRLDSLTVEDGTDRCCSKIPKEHRSHLHHGGSQKSCKGVQYFRGDENIKPEVFMCCSKTKKLCGYYRQT